jgi:hypothetical protein
VTSFLLLFSLLLVLLLLFFVPCTELVLLF